MREVRGNTDTLHGHLRAEHRGAFGSILYKNKTHYIVLKDVKGVPVVIFYTEETEDFDKFVPVAKKVLQSVEWTGT